MIIEKLLSKFGLVRITHGTSTHDLQLIGVNIAYTKKQQQAYFLDIKAYVRTNETRKTIDVSSQPLNTTAYYKVNLTLLNILKPPYIKANYGKYYEINNTSVRVTPPSYGNIKVVWVYVWTLWEAHLTLNKYWKETLWDGRTIAFILDSFSPELIFSIDGKAEYGEVVVSSSDIISDPITIEVSEKDNNERVISKAELKERFYWLNVYF